MMESFFGENGRKYLIFYFTDVDMGGAEPPKSGPPMTASSTSRASSKNNRFKLQIIENTEVTLKGCCIFFTKTVASVAITNANISTVIHFF